MFLFIFPLSSWLGFWFAFMQHLCAHSGFFFYFFFNFSNFLFKRLNSVDALLSSIRKKRSSVKPAKVVYITTTDHVSFSL